MKNDPDTLLQELGAYNLTPVQFKEGVFFKRDDLFAPFGAGSVNGGKLRQGSYLLATAKRQGYTRILTGCSIISPQAPMIAAAAKHFGMECVVFYGGTKLDTLKNRHMPKLAMHYDAEIRIAKSGRASVLLHEARKMQMSGDFIVQYGMNSKDSAHIVPFYESTASQVQNLPDCVDNLAITCGSGITAAGVLYGLQKYGKKVKQVWLLGTAPNRKMKVLARLADLSLLTGVDCWKSKFNYVDLYAEGMTYNKEFTDVSYEGIQFHPHYEAKTFPWVQENLMGKGESLVYWIIGSKPVLLM